MLKRFCMASCVVPLLSVAFCGECAAGEDKLAERLKGPLVITGALITGVNIAMTAHNISGLRADTPGKLGGVGGMLLGSYGALFGAACFFVQEPVFFITGLGCTAAGVVTAYYGVKTLKAVQRKFIEEERGVAFSPVLIDDGSGRLEPGVQVSWRF
jgi:hypothetical protein